jgi:hypothetical protein
MYILENEKSVRFNRQNINDRPQFSSRILKQNFSYNHKITLA